MSKTQRSKPRAGAQSAPVAAAFPKRAAVVGLGYVGLPLALEMARAGVPVTGVDVSEEKLRALSRGETDIPDIDRELLRAAVKDGRLLLSADFAALRECDAISICVPTPLRKTKEPDLSFIIAAADAVSPNLANGALVILESTTYPGTTEELVLPRLEIGGRKVGRDVFLAFSPERVDPGNAQFHTRNTPKILAGVTAACTARAQEWYGRLFDRLHLVSSPSAAEMVKLHENIFRAVNIGLVNELAVMCHRLGLDVWEIIGAAATKPFGFMPFWPGPGLGGHCIPVDPIYLSWKLRSLNYTARFIDLATEVNGSMPRHVVDRVTAALNEREKSVKGARILVLGVAYKKNVSDTRESPAIDVILLLKGMDAKVSYCDPHVPELRDHHLELKASPFTEKRVREADAVLVLTDHDAFDYDLVARAAAYVFDARNALKKSRRKSIERL